MDEKTVFELAWEQQKFISDALECIEETFEAYLEERGEWLRIDMHTEDEKLGAVYDLVEYLKLDIVAMLISKMSEGDS